MILGISCHETMWDNIPVSPAIQMQVTNRLSASVTEGGGMS